MNREKKEFKSEADKVKMEARLFQSEKSIEEIYELIKNLIGEKDNEFKVSQTSTNINEEGKVAHVNLYDSIDNVESLEKGMSSEIDEKQLLERQVSYLKSERVVLLKYRDQPQFTSSHLQDQINTIQMEQENLKQKVHNIISSANLQEKALDASIHLDGENFDLIGEKSQEKQESGTDHFRAEKEVIGGKERASNEEVARMQKEISELKSERQALLDYRRTAEVERQRLWDAIQKISHQQEEQNQGQDERSLRSRGREELSRGLRSNQNSSKHSNTERTGSSVHVSSVQNRSLVDQIEQNRLLVDPVENVYMDASTEDNEPEEENWYNRDFDARSLCSMERKMKLSSIPRRSSGDDAYTHTSSVSNVSSFREKIPDNTLRSTKVNEDFRRNSNNLFDAHNVDLSALADSLRSNMILRDRTWRLYTYKDCFTATETVDYVLKNGFAQSREYATTICLALQIILNLFEHITNKDYQFKDENVFLKFIDRNERASLSLVKVKGYLDLDAIADFVQSQIEIKDRLWHLRKYKNCFVACELVDLFITKKIAQSRGDAVRIGRALGTMCKLFNHVTDEHIFNDEYLFFRFNRPTGTKLGTFYLSGSGWGGTSISWRSDVQGRMALELPPLEENNVIVNMPIVSMP